MKPKFAIHTLILSALLAATAPAATIISQTVESSDAGTGMFGQAFEVDGSLADTLLSSFTIYKGNAGGGALTGFIDVYTLGTANTASLNFSTGAETGNLNFLGSSTNFFDTTAVSDGGAMTWTFASIALPTDVPILLVFSNDSGASTSFTGTSTQVEGATANQNLTNITAASSHTLGFGGVFSTASASQTDNRYSVTLVPEPSAALLGGLGLLTLLRRRR